MNSTYYALITLGSLGFVFGLILAFASKVFHIDKDERIDQVLDALPGANCGGCGYPGCSAYAEAVVLDDVNVTLCAPGGKECSEKISSIMGKVAEEKEEETACLLCNGGVRAKDKFEYSGVSSCKAALLAGNGNKTCDFGCMGFGDCYDVCQFDAIKMSEDNLPVIDEEKCVACGACIEACPKNVLILKPKSKPVTVRCSSKDKVPAKIKYCSVPCISCKKCEKACKFDAIKVIDNVAVIDYTKCVSCGECIKACPKNIITPEDFKPKLAYITDKCIGCGICKKNCPVEAISGETKQRHIVDKDKCIGCSICEKKCPPKIKAIDMIDRV
jgi:electron transport complex protein RnfB